MGDNDMNETRPASVDFSRGSSPLPGMLRICPLCNTELRLLFINFSEKVLLCINVDCEYPFGYEELQYVKDDECDICNDELNSILSRTSTQDSSLTTSTGSGSTAMANFILANNEMDQINSALYPDNTSIGTTSSIDCNFEVPSPITVKKVQENEMKETLNKMKTIAIELQDDTENLPHSIKDPKRLRTLKNLEVLSRKPLLKGGEEIRLKKKQPSTSSDEFKIDINTGNEESVSSIQIKILGQSDVIKR